MSDPVPLADPDLLLSAPLPSHIPKHRTRPSEVATASSSVDHDRALDDITDSFNLDYLTLQHNAEIEHIRAHKHKPRTTAHHHSHTTPPHAHRRRHHPPTGSSAASLSANERSLLEERCAMLERLLHKQSSEMEEYVNSTAQLYVKLSDQQGKMHDERRKREEKERENDELTAKTQHLQHECDRLNTERERERDSHARLITALRREAAEVRAKWIDVEARHQQMTDEYEAHERRYTQRIDELERQRQQWEQQRIEVEDTRGKLAQLKAENERLTQDAVRVGQLTGELSGMQDIVDRLRAERVSFEIDRGAWADERKEREKEIRGLVERLMKEELEVERARLDAATLRQQLRDTSDNHAAERQAIQQRMEQQRAEHNQRIKTVNQQLDDAHTQVRVVKEENERLIHPDHHENTALKQQLITAMHNTAHITQQLHSEEIRRVERDAHDRDRDRQLNHLTAHRKRLIGRVWRERQRLEVQRWFYRWSGWIGERRKKREEEKEEETKGREEATREMEERRREKEGVEAALKELEEKMKRLETGRQKDEDKQRVREEIEEAARRRRQRQQQEDDDERRREEAKREEHKEAESTDDDKRSPSRSPSRHRHRHTHYLSPSLSPSLSPQPALPAISLSGSGSDSYAPLLSALLSMRGAVSGGAAADDELTARMEALLEKMSRLQRMQREHDTHIEQQHTDEHTLSSRPNTGATLTRGTTEPDAAAGTELPIALLAPPTDVALLPPPPPPTRTTQTDESGKQDKGKRVGSTTRSVVQRSSSNKARPHTSPAASRTQRSTTRRVQVSSTGVPSRARNATAIDRTTAGMSAFIQHAVSQHRNTSNTAAGNKRWGNAGRANAASK